jgi:hypothetical protein
MSELEDCMPIPFRPTATRVDDSFYPTEYLDAVWEELSRKAVTVWVTGLDKPSKAEAFAYWVLKSSASYRPNYTHS